MNRYKGVQVWGRGTTDQTPRQACHEPMAGIYGAATVCARPAGHDGRHWPIYNASEWGDDGGHGDAA